MHETGRKRTSTSLAMFGSALVMGVGIVASAQQGHKHGEPLHGGKVAMTKEYHFEVVFTKDGLKVYPRTHEDKPVDASRLTGTATFYHPNSPKPWFERKLQGATTSPGQAPASLDLVIGLSTVPPTGAKVAFEIAGLPDSAESTAAFSVPFEVTKTQTESPATHLLPSPSGVTPSPRYVYGPGYYGFGYYQYPGPETAPSPRSSPTVYGYSTPGGGNRSGRSGGAHDWSTGRDLPSGGLLSKPWLRPRD